MMISRWTGLISRWAGLFAVTATVAICQDSVVENALVENASVSTAPVVGMSSSDARRPITAKQRTAWVISSTLGPQAIIGEAFSAGYGTWRDKPIEFGSHWDGFGKRTGADLSEAGSPFKNRLAHVFVMTFVARNRDGNLMPAYARFIAIPSSTALASTWRPESERSLGSVGARIGLGVLGRMGTNAFAEFWPDVRRIMLRRNSGQASLASSEPY